MATYTPRLLVLMVREKLVRTFLTVTEASVRGAPTVSVTVPRMTPVVAWDWADNGWGNDSATAKSRAASGMQRERMSSTWHSPDSGPAEPGDWMVTVA